MRASNPLKLPVYKSKVGIKGQVIIPSKIRKKYGIKNKSRVCFIDDGNRIVIYPLTKEYFLSIPDKTTSNGVIWKEYLKYKKEEKKKEK